MTSSKTKDDLQSDLEDSLAWLDANLPLISARTCKTHTLLEYDTIDPSADLLRNLGVFLTASIAQCVEFNLAIRQALFDEADLGRDLAASVVSVIGADNSISTITKRDERNPWLWEAISHLLIHLARSDPQRHPPGPVLAKSLIHLDPKDHGLDLFAIYGDMALGVTVGECKAYLGRPAAGIRDAAERLRELDSTDRDSEIRQFVAAAGVVLDDAKRKLLTGAFWRKERCYVPFVCCDESEASAWTRARKSLRSLGVDIDRRILIPLVISDAWCFFDDLSNAIRDYAAEYA